MHLWFFPDNIWALQFLLSCKKMREPCYYWLSFWIDTFVWFNRWGKYDMVPLWRREFSSLTSESILASSSSYPEPTTLEFAVLVILSRSECVLTCVCAYLVVFVREHNTMERWVSACNMCGSRNNITWQDMSNQTQLRNLTKKRSWIKKKLFHLRRESTARGILFLCVSPLPRENNKEKDMVYISFFSEGGRKPLLGFSIPFLYIFSLFCFL